MRKNFKILGAVAVAGVVATTGSAFTATSTIDKAAINVGSVTQSVSGATFTNVAHTYTSSTDTTTALDAKAEQLLSKTAGVVTVHLNNSLTADTGACTVAWTESATGTVGIDDGAADFSSISCDISDTSNLANIRFVVNG